MSLNKKQLLKASMVSMDDDEIDSATPSTRARTAPGQLMGLQAQYQKAVEEIAELKEKIGDAAFQTLPLSALHEVPGRRRNLSAEDFIDLRENLRKNAMVTPITVRVRDAGGYEIVSGHNRVAAYRELGRSTIDSVIQNSDNTQASINAFYANLLQTDLSDFEKYVGFKMIRDALNLSQVEIAEHSGLSKSFVSRLMAFEDLPGAALEIIEKHPGIIGSAAAYKLALIAHDGKADSPQKVVNAVEMLASEKIDQNQAVRIASAGPVAVAPAKDKAIKIKSGKLDYCAMRRVNRSWRIDFKSQEEAVEVEGAIRAVLESRAEQVKSTKK